ncbi:MAG: hypothetical protein CMN32_07050 [Saprospirales bacterium]|nr:hypothetical protein [Saprospirales bacterium]
MLVENLILKLKNLVATKKLHRLRKKTVAKIILTTTKTMTVAVENAKTLLVIAQLLPLLLH